MLPLLAVTVSGRATGHVISTGRTLFELEQVEDGSVPSLKEGVQECRGDRGRNFEEERGHMC